MVSKPRSNILTHLSFSPSVFLTRRLVLVLQLYLFAGHPYLIDFLSTSFYFKAFILKSRYAIIICSEIRTNKTVDKKQSCLIKATHYLIPLSKFSAKLICLIPKLYYF